MALKAFATLNVKNTYQLNNTRPSVNYMVFVKGDTKPYFGDGFVFTQSTFDVDLQERVLYISSKNELKNIKPITGQIVFCTDTKEAYKGADVTTTETNRTDWFDSAGQSIQIGGGDGGEFFFKGTYRTTAPNETVKIFNQTPYGEFVCDFGDGSSETVNSGELILNHEYANAGDHTVVCTYAEGAVKQPFYDVMFESCTALIEVFKIDLSGSIYETSYVFDGCANLVSVHEILIPDSETMAGFFRDCTSLVNLPAFVDTTGVLSMDDTFFNCSSLESMPAWDFSTVKNLLNTWRFCTSLVCFPAITFGPIDDWGSTFDPALQQPPATGTPVRDGTDPTTGSWTNPNPCP